MHEIFKRRSIRKYLDKPVAKEDIDDLLRAAMAAPSAGNEQPWEFIVVDDKNVLKRIADVHPYAKMLYEAPVAIVVCGDLNKEKYKGFWVQDCSAATQNILLEATDKGLGTVWIGVYPDDTRVKDISNIFGIPSNVIPLSIVAVGYPAQEMQEVDRFDPQKIHYNKW
ncbi:nitroreductase family protein [Caloramator sp. CAR-1]|jgi:nitroreductase|uniref:nitroreductase family protein n=1 Tax=Caloramator sp. CAR-1 TaxID=3062777 RepID=UPI0026E42FAA|nr:nitroreductase family protein [Caloramator sp. CAR-1]MDO6353913.1 nitroreductase family protein [Caloramator sp. CAR-1]